MIRTNDEALKNKNNNYTQGGPFGAVITDKNGNIIASSHNSVIASNDPTAHAEVNTIRKACKKLGTHDLSGYILYTSCYPCPMCLSAIIWANIKEVYYGNTKEDANEIGFRDDLIYEYLKNPNSGFLKLIPSNRNICIKTFEDYKNNNEKINY